MTSKLSFAMRATRHFGRPSGPVTMAPPSKATAPAATTPARWIPPARGNGDRVGQDVAGLHRRAQVSATAKKALDETWWRSSTRGAPGTTDRAISTRADRQGA